MPIEGKRTKGSKADASSKGNEVKAGTSTESLKKTNPPSEAQEVGTQKSKEVKIDADAYQVVFFMQHFRVTDIIVKVVDHTLIIDATHREHADEHGLVSRSIIRKQKLPKNVKLDTLASSFTNNGFLVIHAEWLDRKAEMKQN